MEASSVSAKNLAKLVVGKQQKVQLVFNKNVTAEQIHQSLDRIFKESGCTGCGLGGLDLRLIPEEIFRPALQLNDFQQLAGIKQVTVTNL